MADKVVELVNKTGLTYSDAKAGIAIATAAAGQQVVVKDVYVTGSSRSLTLQVNNNEVASLSAPARLSGSEIIGEGTSLTLRKPALPAFSSLGIADNNSALTSYAGKTIFQGDTGLTTSGRVLYQYPSFTYFPYFICQTKNGDIYYSHLGKSNGSYTALHRRAGGISGTQTDLISALNEACFDGSRYIYGLYSTNTLVIVDTSTASASSQALTGLDGKALSLNFSNNFCSMAAIDGFVFICPNGAANSLYMIETSTGKVITLDTTAWDAIPNSSLKIHLGISKNASGEYILIRGVQCYNQNNSTSNLFGALNFGKSLSLVSAPTDLGRFDAGTIPLYGTYGNLLIPILDGEADILMGVGPTSSPQLFSINLSSLTITTYGTCYSNYAPICAFAVLDKSKLNQDFGTFGIRATGILSS